MRKIIIKYYQTEKLHRLLNIKSDFRGFFTGKYTGYKTTCNNYIIFNIVNN